MGYAPERWHDVFAMLGGAAAVLTGLVFVALSIHVRAVGQDRFQRLRSHYLTYGLIYLTVIAACVLIPGQSDTALGIEVLVGGVIAVALVGFPLLRLRPEEPPTLGFQARIAAAAIAIALNIAAGLSLMAGQGGGLYLLIAALLLALVTNVSAAWSMLVGLTLDVS